MFGRLLSNKWFCYLEVLKVLHCVDRHTLEEILGADKWEDTSEMDNIWMGFRQSVFHGLCTLDLGNLNKVCEYANSQSLFKVPEVL